MFKLFFMRIATPLAFVRGRLKIKQRRPILFATDPVVLLCNEFPVKILNRLFASYTRKKIALRL